MDTLRSIIDAIHRFPMIQSLLLLGKINPCEAWWRYRPMFFEFWRKSLLLFILKVLDMTSMFVKVQLIFCWNFSPTFSVHFVFIRQSRFQPSLLLLDEVSSLPVKTYPDYYYMYVLCGRISIQFPCMQLALVGIDWRIKTRKRSRIYWAANWVSVWVL